MTPPGLSPGDRVGVLMPLPLGHREVDPAPVVVGGVVVAPPREREAVVEAPGSELRTVYSTVRVRLDAGPELDVAIERVRPLPGAPGDGNTSPLG